MGVLIEQQLIDVEREKESVSSNLKRGQEHVHDLTMKEEELFDERSNILNREIEMLRDLCSNFKVFEYKYVDFTLTLTLILTLSIK